MCHSNCGSGCGGNCRGGMCTWSSTVKVLLIVGGLNWGLVGVGQILGSTESWNVVNMLLGGMPVLEGIVYLLVGLAAAVKLFGGCRCSTCKGGVCMNCAHDGKSETKV